MLFTYKGYRFTPEEMLPVNKLEDTARFFMYRDRSLGMHPGGKAAYCKADFEQAAGVARIFDVFKCEDNNKYYIPTEKELMLYTGTDEILSYYSPKPPIVSADSEGYLPVVLGEAIYPPDTTTG